MAQLYAAFAASCLFGLSLLLPVLELSGRLWDLAAIAVVAGAPIALWLSWSFDLSVRVTAGRPEGYD